MKLQNYNPAKQTRLFAYNYPPEIKSFTTVMLPLAKVAHHITPFVWPISVFRIYRFASFRWKPAGYFFIFSLAAYAPSDRVPPLMEEVEITLDRIWNRNNLAPADLSDPHRLTPLVREELSALGADHHRQRRA